MRVLRRRRAVRRPARVGDSRHRGLALHLGGQVVDARNGAHEVDGPIVQHRYAAGVVAAVLEPPQSLDQDRNDVTARRRADDAAHLLTPFSWAASTTARTPAARAPR